MLKCCLGLGEISFGFFNPFKLLSCRLTEGQKLQIQLAFLFRTLQRSRFGPDMNLLQVLKSLFFLLSQNARLILSLLKRLSRRPLASF